MLYGPARCRRSKAVVCRQVADEKRKGERAHHLAGQEAMTPAFRKLACLCLSLSLSLSLTHTHFDRTHGLPTVVLARFLLVPEVSAALALAGLVVMVLEEQLRPCKQPPTLLYHGLAGPDPSLPVCPVPKAAKGLTATIGLASRATAPSSYVEPQGFPPEH